MPSKHFQAWRDWRTFPSPAMYQFRGRRVMSEFRGWDGLRCRAKLDRTAGGGCPHVVVSANFDIVHGAVRVRQDSGQLYWKASVGTLGSTSEGCALLRRLDWRGGSSDGRKQETGAASGRWCSPAFRNLPHVFCVPMLDQDCDFRSLRSQGNAASLAEGLNPSVLRTETSRCHSHVSLRPSGWLLRQACSPC